MIWSLDAGWLWTDISEYLSLMMTWDSETGWCDVKTIETEL
jgi:hypothetical protein